MSRDERRRRMLNDPDLTGDLLLFAMALDEVIVTRREQGRRSLRNWVIDVAALAHGTDRAYYVRHWGRNVVGDDIPRYEPQGSNRRGIGCVAPMLRREGLCGKRSSVLLTDYEPETGIAQHVGLCARHRGLEAGYEQRRLAWIEHGKPLPPANTGGVLRRYFDADWDAIYHWARPGLKPMEGGREATPPRPKLRLLSGGLDPNLEVRDGA
ncbi:hypothetical protein ACWCW7_34460 [Nocardia tengchongensis]